MRYSRTFMRHFYGPCPRRYLRSAFPFPDLIDGWYGISSRYTPSLHSIWWTAFTTFCWPLRCVIWRSPTVLLVHLFGLCSTPAAMFCIIYLCISDRLYDSRCGLIRCSFPTIRMPFTHVLVMTLLFGYFTVHRWLFCSRSAVPVDHILLIRERDIDVIFMIWWWPVTWWRDYHAWWTIPWYFCSINLFPDGSIVVVVFVISSDLTGILYSIAFFWLRLRFTLLTEPLWMTVWLLFGRNTIVLPIHSWHRGWVWYYMSRAIHLLYLQFGEADWRWLCLSVCWSDGWRGGYILGIHYGRPGVIDTDSRWLWLLLFICMVTLRWRTFVQTVNTGLTKLYISPTCCLVFRLLETFYGYHIIYVDCIYITVMPTSDCPISEARERDYSGEERCYWYTFILISAYSEVFTVASVFYWLKRILIEADDYYLWPWLQFVVHLVRLMGLCLWGTLPGKWRRPFVVGNLPFGAWQWADSVHCI
jgi:hypothetical protein